MDKTERLRQDILEQIQRDHWTLANTPVNEVFPDRDFYTERIQKYKAWMQELQVKT